MKRFIAFTLTALLLVPLSALFAAEATSLRCEYLNDPVGIDVTRPRMGWNLQEKGPASDVRGLPQTAYQVLVASTDELLKMDKGGYPAEGYIPVNVVDGPGGTLSAQAAPPIKVMQEFQPVTIKEPKPGVRVYDFGQNCSSMPKLTVNGPAGAVIKMTPGEWLDDNGLVSQVSSGGPTYCTYTLKGGEKETWSPQFFITDLAIFRLKLRVMTENPRRRSSS